MTTIKIERVPFVCDPDALSPEDIERLMALGPSHVLLPIVHADRDTFRRAYIQELPMRPLYIFDLDGTLALTEHRQHLVRCEKPDWSAFFRACVDDQPNWPVVSVLQTLLSTGADIQIWSGRSAEVMNETLEWLHLRVGLSEESEEVRLVMRREGDFTPDEQLKRAWLEAMPEYDRRRLVCVFDDRDKVVAMWRAAGVCCCQVAPGAF